MAWFERLSSLDASFLHFEDRTAHMHVGALAVFRGPPPKYGELVRLIESRLPRVPRYRQRLAFVPFQQGRPVWVDDAHFDIEYHVRHTALPSPGGEDALRKLSGRLFAQRLDRDKPLWELWFVEGLEDDRFALVSKTHHCMIDGISGVDIATVLLDAVEEASAPPVAAPWEPRPSPAPTELFVDGLRSQLLDPIELARKAFEPSTEARNFVREMAGGIKPLMGMMRMGSAPESSLNQPIGPHRRFEFVRLDLAAVRRVRATLGGTVNDVILAVMAGALRALLLARGEAPSDDLRVLVPVSVRGQEGRGTLGNQVTAIFCPLPIGEPDPKKRLERVRAEMGGLKESKQAVGALALSRLGEFAPPTLVAQAARLSAMTRFFNLVITNVPGPQFPLYLLGRKLHGCYPCVPLAAQQTISIGLLSYDGTVGVGLLGDADRMRDIGDLGRAITDALVELEAAGAPAPETSARASV